MYQESTAICLSNNSLETLPCFPAEKQARNPSSDTKPAVN